MRGPDDQMSMSEQVQSQAACLLSLCSCKDERDMSSPAHFCLAEGLTLQFELALQPAMCCTCPASRIKIVMKPGM